MIGLARLFIGIVTAVPLGSCGQAAPDKGRIVVTSKDEKRDAQSLLQALGIRMPPATVEFYEYAAGMDDSASVIMVMSEGDWAAMRKAPPLSAISPGRWSSSDVVLLPRNHGRWRPRDDASVIAAQTSLPNAEALTVGYSPAGPERVRVYLFWNQT